MEILKEIEVESYSDVHYRFLADYIDLFDNLQVTEIDEESKVIDEYV